MLRVCLQALKWQVVTLLLAGWDTRPSSESRGVTTQPLPFAFSHQDGSCALPLPLQHLVGASCVPHTLRLSSLHGEGSRPDRKASLCKIEQEAARRLGL